MASDGSSDSEENVMTFGWKIVDENKDLLVEHLGPAFGKATPFYVEEWDIIAQAAVTLCSYRSRPTMFRVKSYQDDDKEEEDLDLPAPLNEAADNLATIYHIQYGQPLPLIPQVA
eukprot:6255018-Ditylum_brightwellii.AAC.1